MKVLRPRPLCIRHIALDGEERRLDSSNCQLLFQSRDYWLPLARFQINDTPPLFYLVELADDMMDQVSLDPVEITVREQNYDVLLQILNLLQRIPLREPHMIYETVLPEPKNPRDDSDPVLVLYHFLINVLERTAVANLQPGQPQPHPNSAGASSRFSAMRRDLVAQYVNLCAVYDSDDQSSYPQLCAMWTQKVLETITHWEAEVYLVEELSQNYSPSAVFEILQAVCGKEVIPVIEHACSLVIAKYVMKTNTSAELQLLLQLPPPQESDIKHMETLLGSFYKPGQFKG